MLRIPTSRLILTVLLVVALALPVTVTAGADRGARAAPGAPGVGDEYFPEAGNTGYNVTHYRLRLRYDPASDRLTGTAQIRAYATIRLTRFTLDLVGLTVRRVEIDGRRVRHRYDGEHELTVVPRRAIRRDNRFTVTVEYRGTPGPLVDADGFEYGWIPTDDGAIVANEPDGAPTWYPVNDHPTDQARYDIAITVPRRLEAISNGRLVSRRTQGAWRTWRWVEDDRMPSYLTLVAIGQFDVDRYRVLNGRLRMIDAIDEDLVGVDEEGRARTPQMVRFFARTFGPYPFTTFGAVVDDANIGYALETQTRPIYASESPPDEATVAHELAHQWYGNEVTLGRWQDIWLNEGFATYAEWLWFEETGQTWVLEEGVGGDTAEGIFDALYALPADHAIWAPAPGDPGPDDLFETSVYIRGAMTLQALRETIGDEDFLRVLRRWYRDNRDRTVTTDDLLALSEEVSGEQLDDLFDAWLYTTDKPPEPGEPTPSP